MKLSKMEFINKGVMDNPDLKAAKAERKALRNMLAKCHGNDCIFPDKSFYLAADAKRRINELTYVVIPELHRQQTIQRFEHPFGAYHYTAPKWLRSLLVQP